MIVTSVRTGDRAQGKLKVLDAARLLSTYTLQVTKNEKVFPKSWRFSITSKIIDETLKAGICIQKANATRVDGEYSEEMRKYRTKQQHRAHAHLRALYYLLDTAYNMEGCGISGDRMEYWTKLIDDTEKLLSAWIRSDNERYKQ